MKKYKKYSADEIETMLRELHGDQVTIDKTTYTNFRNQARFIDKEHGEWFTTPRCVIQQNGTHPKRRGRRCLTLDEVKRRVFETHGDKITINELTFKYATHECILIDKEFGQFVAKPCDVAGGLCHPSQIVPTSGEKKAASFKRHCQEKYGIDNVFQLKDVQEKSKQTYQPSVVYPFECSDSSFQSYS